MKTFQSKKELEIALSNQILNDLSVSIANKNKATLLLSGGSTPKGVYELLSEGNLDWSKITVGLVDERFVSNTSTFSNEKLLRQTLFQNNAIESAFIPMVQYLDDKIKNIKLLEQSYQVFKNADVILLGMGEDGHTASLFPNDLNSELAFETSDLVVITNAPTEPSCRISCSPVLLDSAQNSYLMITGAKKKLILDTSVEKKLPMGHFLPQLKEIYYSEK